MVRRTKQWERNSPFRESGGWECTRACLYACTPYARARVHVCVWHNCERKNYQCKNPFVNAGSDGREGRETRKLYQMTYTKLK